MSGFATGVHARNLASERPESCRAGLKLSLNNRNKRSLGSMPGQPEPFSLDLTRTPNPNFRESTKAQWETPPP
jgi:hypothetical protein